MFQQDITQSSSGLRRFCQQKSYPVTTVTVNKGSCVLKVARLIQQIQLSKCVNSVFDSRLLHIYHFIMHTWEWAEQAIKSAVVTTVQSNQKCPTKVTTVCEMTTEFNQHTVPQKTTC